jgi:hypothetical protein
MFWRSTSNIGYDIYTVPTRCPSSCGGMDCNKTDNLLVGLFGHGNELFCFIKAREFLDHLYNYQL